MRRSLVAGSVFAGAAIVAAVQQAYGGTMPLPSPAPAASPAPGGPCEHPALASIAVRPGLGRAPATSGAVCVAPPGVVVIGAGYRNQATVGSGRQRLAVFPEPVALIGVGERVELIAAPGLILSHRTGSDGSAFAPGSGQQDAGAGLQLLVSDRPALQQAVAFFATVPTGYPHGPSGFSTGRPVEALSYTAAFAAGALFGFSTSQAVVVASGFTPLGAVQRYTAYQPAVNVSYMPGPATTLLLENQITTPGGAGAPTGNRALLGLVQTLSPNAILDAEFEINLLPSPGFAQHALGAGLTLRL